MAMDSIRLFAAAFGLNLLWFITAVWKQPIASGSRKLWLHIKPLKFLGNFLTPLSFNMAR